MDSVSATTLMEHLRVLTVDIGERLAGTAGEREAGRYIAEQFGNVGAQAYEEPFPVRARVVDSETLDIRLGDRWQRFPASLFSNTPGTNGACLEAPLVFFEAPSDYQRPDLSFLRGKAVVHLGTHIESRESYRRLLEAAPAFILMVDIRYPGSHALADGMFPAYTEAIGAVPTMNVAFQDAWQWHRSEAGAARLCVDGGMVAAESSNIIGELTGSDPDAGVLYVGGHHDTQAGNPGADDNGTGVIALLELARVLSKEPRRRTIRLISFGAEEQLSVGSASYVRHHRQEVAEQGVFMFNLDSFGSGMGWTTLVSNGPAALSTWLRQRFNAGDVYPLVEPTIVPYSDHFPFVAAGLPSVWLGRDNCRSGRFFHHRYDDVMDKVCASTVARHVQITAELLQFLANVDAVPFSKEIPTDQAEDVAHFWQDLFGGW